MRFAIFPCHLSKVLRLPRESDARSYEVLHLSRKIILANLKTWCCKMQPLSGNQCPDLLTSLVNMSLVLHLPREIHLCRSSSNVPARHRFWKCDKTVTFCSLWAGCTIPCAGHAKRHLSVQKWSNTVSLTLLTSKCASHHNDVYFFNISTSQSAPRRLVFSAFDSEMCFAPQRRALFRHLNFKSAPRLRCCVHCTFWVRHVLCAPSARAPFEHRNFHKCSEHGVFCTFWRPLLEHRNFHKCSEHGVLCTFWLPSVLRATTGFAPQRLSPFPHDNFQK